MTLYELKDEIVKAAMNVTIDEETGEIIGGEALDALNIAFDEKLEGCAVWYKGLIADIDALKSEEKALKERRERLERRADYFRQYIDDCMTAADKKSFESSKCVIKYRKSTVVDVYDETALPKQYVVEKVTYQPDKKLIGEVLKSGKAVNGATLVEKNNISVK